MTKHKIRTQELDYQDILESMPNVVTNERRPPAYLSHHSPAVSPTGEKKKIKMIRTCRLFLVLLHRTFLLAAVLIGGTYAFQAIENHYRESEKHANTTQPLDLTQAAQFCYTIITTTGYGSVKAVSDWGKVFTIVYAIIGIPVALFTIGAYGAFLNHCILKMIMGMEHCCCSCWQGKKMNLKVFIILILLFLAEIFCFAVYVQWLEDDWSYLDAVYAWFLTMTTIGFKEHNPYPDDQNLLHALAYLVVSLFSIITLAAMYQIVQAMMNDVNNQSRGPCAIMFCCYSNDRKDDYTMSKYSSNHSMRYSEYPHD